MERCLLNSNWNTTHDRGILKGTFHLVGNTTSLFLCLVFFRFHKAPRMETVDVQVEEREGITSREKRSSRGEWRELCGDSACKSRKSRNFPCVKRVFVWRCRLNTAFIESVNQVWQINCRSMTWTLDGTTAAKQSILFRDINSEP